MAFIYFLNFKPPKAIDFDMHIFQSPIRCGRSSFQDLSLVSQRQGECYATASMWKVELELEFNFLSVSVFLSRLVRQVISVPFVI